MSFHARTTPLDGLNLIEASAGTGKTWTIAALYARLVLEKHLRPEQILVVTYTKAATAELRGRIRARLAELADALEQADDEQAMAQLAEHDPHFLLPLVQGRDDAVADARRVRAAVSGFDAAAVFTIHGFCQRALGEHALTAGLELNRHFVADETELLQAVADAAWTDMARAATPDWLGFLIEKNETPDQWVAQLRSWLGMPGLTVALPAQQDTDALHAQFTASHTELAKRWLSAEGDAARQWLEDSLAAKLLAGKTHRRDWAEAAIRYWHGWLSAPPRAVVEMDVKLKDEPAGKVWRLFASRLAEANKGPSTVPSLFDDFAPLVDLALNLQRARIAALAALHGGLIRELAMRLHARKAQLGVMSFHDLLVELDAALAASSGDVLATALRKRYQAALIDEFQDTDPLQFRIFDRLFGDGAQPTFLVGDPKQAIYGFRGAELHAYLAARQRVPLDRRFSLSTNRRSTPALVRSVEALFRCASAPFLLPELDFPSVAALPDKPVLRIDGIEQAALAWHWLADTPLDKGVANQLAATQCAQQIAHLLALGAEQRATLGELPVRGSDIAVLAGSHTELAAMQAALASVGVASVRIGRESVFSSTEAQDLLQVLNALCEVNDRSVRTALATPLVGLPAEAFYELLQHDADWEATLANFRLWHGLLRQRGPMAALSAWLHDSGTADRLASWADGERRLTNVLHLFELIELEHHERPGLAPLMAWYRQALVAATSGEDDGRLMRLESDAARVRLVTIHAAKGLEYPIVFCPFLWNGQLFKQKERFPLCHEGEVAVLDLGSPQMAARWQLAQQERLAEKLRLLYVALTRPRSMCVMSWGAVKSVEESALGWLLAAGNLTARPIETMREEVDALCRQAAGEMQWLQAWPMASHVDTTESPARLMVASLPRRLAWQWRMSSFSALTAGEHKETPDRDALPTQVEALAEVDAPLTPPNAFDQFPAGPRAGICLHSLFEDWDFCRRDRRALEQLATRHLRAEGLDEHWASLAADIVEITLATPLTDTGTVLAGLPAPQRLVELEFTFVLQPFSWPALADLLANEAFGLPPDFARAAATLSAEVGAGFLKGFIDLSCELDGRHYIIDWKSNRLAAYDTGHLNQAMATEHYYLQALIYCVALHRYLRWRRADYDYERDMGGAIYLFLRGLPRGGVWRYRPPLALIESLEVLLCGSAG